jgi:hypothetical protein
VIEGAWRATCPRVAEFARCDSDPDGCGEGVVCTAAPHAPGMRCMRPCSNVYVDCVNSPEPAFDERAQDCSSEGTGLQTYCFIVCSTSDSTCPTGSTCRLDPGATEGFCW